MAAAGKIQRRMQVDPATNQTVALLHAGDIERIAYEREHPEEAPAAAPPPAKSPARRDSVLPSLSALLPHLAAITPPPSLPAWLNLDQAAEYTGLSRELLLRLIHAGTLPALKDQPIKSEGNGRAKAGSSWRVCRRDLDALQGVSHSAGQTVHA